MPKIFLHRIIVIFRSLKDDEQNMSFFLFYKKRIRRHIFHIPCARIVLRNLPHTGLVM